MAHAHFLLVVSSHPQVGCQHSRSCVVGGQVRGYTSANGHMASMESAGGTAAHAKSVVLWGCNSHPLLLPPYFYRIACSIFFSASAWLKPLQTARHTTRASFCSVCEQVCVQQVPENPVFLHNFSSFLNHLNCLSRSSGKYTAHIAGSGTLNPTNIHVP